MYLELQKQEGVFDFASHQELARDIIGHNFRIVGRTTNAIWADLRSKIRSQADLAVCQGRSRRCRQWEDASVRKSNNKWHTLTKINTSIFHYPLPSLNRKMKGNNLKLKSTKEEIFLSPTSSNERCLITAAFTVTPMITKPLRATVWCWKKQQLPPLGALSKHLINGPIGRCIDRLFDVTEGELTFARDRAR